MEIQRRKMQVNDRNREKEGQEKNKKWKEKWLNWVWDFRDKNGLNENRALKAVITYALAIVLMITVCSFFNYAGLWKDNMNLACFGEENGFNYQDILFTQISVSFIVISLTTVLSSNSKVVYWVDLIQMELVDPILTDFLAYSMYIFACLTASAYFVICESDYIYISFTVSIVLMVFLTIKMIAVNFENEHMRRKIRMYYDWIAGKEKESDLYKDMMNTFVNTTIKYAQEKNVVAFFENFDFLYENFERKKGDPEYKKGELEGMCLIIELLGRENDFFLRQILSQIDIDDNEENGKEYKYNGLKKDIKYVMNTVKNTSTLENMISSLCF